MAELDGVSEADVQLFAQPRGRKRSAAKSEASRKPRKAAKRDARETQSSTDRYDGEHAVDASVPHTALDAEPSVDTTFAALGLREHLHNVCTTLGMDSPTEIQKGVIPAVLQGRDCIGVAQTGSGKTAAFALPIIDKLTDDRFGVHSLVLTPTRELAFQLSEQFEALGSGAGVKHLVVVGGMDQHAQSVALLKRPHVVVATPGRLAEMLRTSKDLAAVFKRVATLVLDEADRVLEATFEQDLRCILQVLGKKRQTLLFTATMTQDVTALQHVLSDPFVYRAYEGLKTADNLRENYVLVPAKVKEVYLIHLLALRGDHNIRSTIIFCSKRSTCELISGLLYQLGIPAASLHGGKKQRARLAALHQFKSSAVPVLVATDVAARGLDIPTVDLVLNFELPTVGEEYVHRVGRTARAGRSGWALTLVSQYDIKLLKSIEGTVGHELTVFEVDEDAAMSEITKVFAARRAALLAIETKKNLV